MSSVSLAFRPNYTQQELEQYYDYISFPSDYRLSKDICNTKKGLDFINKLIKHQLSAVPFENLDLHYSVHHSITLDSHALFDKFVKRQNGRGGYCMENNTFFGSILRTIGFDVMSVGGRVSLGFQPDLDPSQKSNRTGFPRWGHMVNIIKIQGHKYLVDVGFGNGCPTFAVPLEDGFTSRNTGKSDEGSVMRLDRETIPNNTHRDQDQLLWVYKIRFSDDTEWMSCYCFTDIEFLPGDFDALNFFMSRSPESWFTKKVMCTIYLRDEEAQNIIGSRTLFDNKVKERKDGKSIVLLEIENEQQRIQALKKFFNLTLTLEEQKGIRGMESMIS